MITIILILIIIVVTTMYVVRNRTSFYTQARPGGSIELKFGKIFKTAALFLLFFFIAIFQPFVVERVDSSGVGLKVNLTGSKRGIDDYKYATGWVVVNTWTEMFKEFPINQQHVQYPEQNAFAKGGFTITIKPTFNYALKKGTVGDMYMNLRLDLRELEQGWLQTAMVGAINDVANRWSIDDIFNKREEFERQIQAESNKRLSKWFEISQIRTNILPPPSLQAAIEAKTQAIQQAQAEDQKALTAEAEARKKIAIAKGDSAQAVISASGEAKAIQLKQQQITPAYIEYIKWSRANSDVPRVPSTVLGNGTGTMVNLR